MAFAVPIAGHHPIAVRTVRGDKCLGRFPLNLAFGPCECAGAISVPSRKQALAVRTEREVPATVILILPLGCGDFADGLASSGVANGDFDIIRGVDQRPSIRIKNQFASLIRWKMEGVCDAAR